MLVGVVFDGGAGRVRLDRLNALFGVRLRLVSLAGSDDLAADRTMTLRVASTLPE